MPRKPLTKLYTICLLAAGLLCPAHANSSTSTYGVNVSATIVSKGKCKFTNTTVDPATLKFGILNPLSPLDVTVDTGTQLNFSCNGNGSNPVVYLAEVTASTNGTASSPRMSDPSGTFFLPYELSLNPASGSAGKTEVINLVVTGTVRFAGYQTLPAEDYTDTVIVSIIP